MKNTVLIGISSGIAAYKVLELVKKLLAAKHTVEVIMTQNATRMLPVREVEEILKKPIHSSLYPSDFSYTDILKNRVVDHIALADKAAAFVIAPATANTIAKLAHGIADDYITTTALASTCPIIVCPSMNVNMWNNPVTQNNIKLLQKAGMIIIEPEEGALACGYEGKGRLASIETIFNEVEAQISTAKMLVGKRIIITAGATEEPVDAVRIITNRSTGKMGVALAEECYLQGADVLLLRAKNSVEPRYPVQQKTFETPEQLEELIFQEKEADIIFHAAAVGDFTVKQRDGKLPSDTAQTIQLEPRHKILDKIRSKFPSAIIVGFKAEFQPDDALLAVTAEKRLAKAEIDFVVANDISKNDRGFGADTNAVTVVTKTGKIHSVALASKREVAKQILDVVTATASFQQPAK